MLRLRPKANSIPTIASVSWWIGAPRDMAMSPQLITESIGHLWRIRIWGQPWFDTNCCTFIYFYLVLSMDINGTLMFLMYYGQLRISFLPGIWDSPWFFSSKWEYMNIHSNIASSSESYRCWRSTRHVDHFLLKAFMKSWGTHPEVFPHLWPVELVQARVVWKPSRLADRDVFGASSKGPGGEKNMMRENHGDSHL